MRIDAVSFLSGALLVLVFEGAIVMTVACMIWRRFARNDRDFG